ncbi:MAG: alpha/beta fold hydrolase [Pseudomonadota bacterium]
MHDNSGLEQPQATLPDDLAGLSLLDRASIHLATPLHGGAMAWRRWGKGPPLVLVHGGAGSWRHWFRNIPALAERHTVYVPDLPGLGDSSDMLSPAQAAIGFALAEGMQALVPQDAPIDLVGFSFGALVSSQAAAAAGDRVRRLVLIGPGALGLPRVNIKLEKWRGETDANAIRAIHRRNLSRLMIADAKHIDDMAISIQHENGLLARLKSWAVTPPDALARVLPQIHGDKLHVIYGSRDAVAGPHLDARRDFFSRIAPEGRFRLVPGAGHWAAYEAPDTIDALLREFLAPTESTATGTP